MASETSSPGTTRAGTPSVSPTWLRELSAGLVGGLGMGTFLSLTAPAVLDGTLPALVGLSGPLAGWGLHLAASVLLGIVFTTAVERRSRRRPLSTVAVVGIGYSILPWLDPSVLAGLLIYGVVLGVAHWLLG